MTSDLKFRQELIIRIQEEPFKKDKLELLDLEAALDNNQNQHLLEVQLFL